MKKSLILFLILLSSSAFSFVENVTHGYPNCMACHVSPTGGGLLTDYGRALSSELMSTIKTKDINGPFFGVVKNTPHLKWGGDYRAVQTRFENNQLKAGSQFTMQNNVEAAAYVKDFVAVVTAGRKEGPENRISDKGEFISERHYLMYSPDPTSRIRLGKFRQNFGLNDPNHTRFVKKDLGFGSYSETYQMEYFKILETGELVLSSSLGRIDIPQMQSERNIMGQYTYYLNGKGRVSANVLFGESPTERRSLWGINGILPLFGNHSVFRFDVAYRMSQGFSNGAKQEKEQGLFGYALLGHKVYDGVFPYLIYEHKQDDLEESRLSMVNSPGVGLQLFPMAHFDVQLEHQYRKSVKNKDNPEHRSMALFHVYY
ncbi:MAG: hypothetical protein NXH75_06120 [Halobacteriovoraceae bacterium]|nr:hypothetical protein [Halobacteriovoraceae bacterium]